jgi:DNA modification methylase
MAWESRIVGHGDAAPADLVGNPRNWRTHPKAQRDALAGVLDQVGWVQDVIVNKRTGYLVDGHARVAVAAQRGEASVPVVYVDLSEDEELLILATLDPLAAMAEADTEVLADLLASVTSEDAALTSMLDALAKAEGIDTAVEGLTDPDDVPEPPDEPYVQRGDLYQLGAHRILCGDSTDATDVARLLDGAKPNLMVTDPPYGVDYDPVWRDAVNGLTEAERRIPIAERPAARGKRRRGEVVADDRADWREAWALSPSDVAYVWHGGLHAAEVQASLESVGFEMRAQIVWVKQALVFGRGAYHWQHEPCWMAVRKGSTASWIGDRKQTTVWEIPNANLHNGGEKDDADTNHSTQKPVECMERPIRNHAGDVYEPFAGSGTTLIAAERQGRTCYAMEIEPKYVQVCIDRWEAFTGLKAERV